MIATSCRHARRSRSNRKFSAARASVPAIWVCPSRITSGAWSRATWAARSQGPSRPWFLILVHPVAPMLRRRRTRCLQKPLGQAVASPDAPHESLCRHLRLVFVQRPSSQVVSRWFDPAPVGSPGCRAILGRPAVRRRHRRDVSAADLDSAWEIGRSYRDQDFSLVDRTSFAVMRRLGIDRVASLDDDFAIFRFGPGRRLAFTLVR